MFSKTITLSLFLFLITALSLVGCQSGEPQPEEDLPLPNMANPASIYCQGLGFQEETRENELGQYGVCLLPEGLECDSWDFLAGRCGQEHSYCAQQGYELETVDDGNIANCVFEDGSMCSEFLYFQGDCKPGENLP